jgi:pimeloyl-ACP methyl ester carboxylesterase
MFDADGVAINYLDAGPADGPPIVFLHGVTGRWQTWLTVAPAFAARWRVYALDFRGHGRSGHIREGYRAVDYAADAIAFLRREVGRPTVLVGHSLGAIVAIAVAADAPELVRAVVLEDPPLGAFDDQRFSTRPEHARFTATRDLARRRLPAEKLFAELWQQTPDADAAAVGTRTQLLSQMDPDVLTLILDGRSREGYGLRGRLSRIACPVLLLQGNPERGGALDHDRAVQTTAALARCTHRYLSHVGHSIHGDQPFEFNDIVAEWLAAQP